MKKIIKILGTAGGKKAPQVPIDEATVKKMLKPSQQDNRKRKNNQRFNELLG
ncbi:MAG: hypothetical protein PHF31_01970 [Methylobacter sp.]|nr:hypothetical protein [Methylobacter sp.]